MSSAATRRIRPSIAITVPVPVSVAVAVSITIRGGPVHAIGVTAVSRGCFGLHLWRWVVVVSPRSTGGTSVLSDQFRRRNGFLVVWGVVNVLGRR